MPLYSRTAVTTADGVAMPIDVYAPPDARHGDAMPRVIFLPGAFCDAARYAWLGDALSAAGALVLIADPPTRQRSVPDGSGFSVEIKAATIDDLVRMLPMAGQPGERFAWDLRYGPELILGGHSAGGAAVLELLDPLAARRNPMARLPDDLVAPPPLAGVFVLGAHLQAEAMGRVSAWRNDAEPLGRQPGLPLLIIAAEHDGMATPAKARATWERYAPPAWLLLQHGANHFSWTTNPAPRDRTDLDGHATIDAALIRHRTATYLTTFLHGRSPADVSLPTMWADASAWGDTLLSR